MHIVSRHKLHNMISVPEMEFHCGHLFVQGSGYRIGVFANGELKHMSAQRARRLADEYEAETDCGDVLKPVCEALRAIADGLEGMGIAGAEVDGRG